jgi:ribokinase
MAKIVNFGSLNLDYVYSLPHMVRPGETLSCTQLYINNGGKGLNQSVALARAGAKVIHAGIIGNEGTRLKEFLHENGADTSLIRQTDTTSGHAIIQVDKNGQNAIFVYGGANRVFTMEYISEAAELLDRGDFVLLQNETNLTDEAARMGKEKGAKIVLNPSPIDDWLLHHFPFELVDLLFLNETEGAVFLEIMIDPDENVLPMIPAGKTVSAMITE